MINVIWKRITAFPANICWSWRRLQHVFSLTILRLPRRLEDILQDALKTSWKMKNCYPEDVLKTCLEDVLKTYLEDVLKTLWRETKYLLGISVSNKSKCVSNKSILHKSISDNSKVNPNCINKNPIISLFLLFWNSSSIYILRIKISDDWFGVVKSAEFKFEIAEKVRQ